MLSGIQRQRPTYPGLSPLKGGGGRYGTVRADSLSAPLGGEGVRWGFAARSDARLWFDLTAPRPKTSALNNPGDPQHVRRAWCAEGDAGGDDQAFRGPGEIVLHRYGARLVHHIVEILNVFGENTLHAPSDG